MRTIKTQLVIPSGQKRTIKTNFMQVRSTLGLPALGEPVRVVEMFSGAEYPGQVIEVDRVRHGFTAEVKA